MYQLTIIKTFDDDGKLINIEERLSVFEASNEASNETVETPKASDGQVVLDNGKLVLNEAAVALLDAQVGDKICVQYEQVGNDFVPVIGKDSNMGKSLNGNKLTKKLTISFKGKQSDSLRMYGEVFTMKEYGNNVYKLVGDCDLETVTDEEVTVNEELIVNDNDKTSLADLEKSSEDITFDFSFDLDDSLEL